MTSRSTSYIYLGLYKKLTLATEIYKKSMHGGSCRLRVKAK